MSALPARNTLSADGSAIADFLINEVGGAALHLVAITPDGPTEGRWFGGDAAAAARWASDLNAAGKNIYWTTNQARPGLNRKPSKADIVRTRFAHVDIDPPKGGGSFDKAAKIAELESATLPPTFILDSGGGLQAFWRLDGAATGSDVEGLNRALVARFGGDPSCWNADRLMRLPGTVNIPNAKKRAAGRKPVLASLVSPDIAGAKVAPERLRSAFPVAANDQHEPVAFTVAEWQPQTPASLGIGFDDPIYDLLTASEGDDRSAETFAAACELVRRGFDDAQIFGLLLNSDLAISGHCLDQADPERAVSRAVGKARHELAEELASFPFLANNAAVASGAISATPYGWPAPYTIPQRQWLYGRQVLRGTVSVIVAPGGTGKSAYTIGMALALATGRPLLGKDVPGGPQKVWLWNLEDARDELDRAIAAAAWAHELKPDDAAGRLFVDSGLDGAGLCTAYQTRNGFTVQQPIYDALVAEIETRGIDCLIVDPFVSSQAVSENDNGAIDAVAKAWARVAARTGCAIVLVHHTSKLGGGEVTAERARGASALVNAARSVLALNRMTPEEGKHFGIEGGDVRRHFRTYDDKNNRAPAAETSDWFRMESVDLPNGENGDLTGDSVGVVMPWTPPTAKAVAKIEEGEVVAIQKAIANGEWREHPSADLWAGKPIARALGLNLEDDAQRARMKGILEARLRSGVLRTEQRKDSKSMLRSWIVVGNPHQSPSGSETAFHSSTLATGEDCGSVWKGASSCSTPHPAPFRGGMGVEEAGAVSDGEPTLEDVGSASGSSAPAGLTSDTPNAKPKGAEQ